MSEKIYRVQMNSKGMPNFATAVEIEDIPIYGNEHNCMMTIFGACSYAETGCGDCAVVEKVRKALSADRPQVSAELRADFLKRQYEAVLDENKRLKADRPQGEWKTEYHGNGWNDYWDYTCSNCGKRYARADAVLYKANYCPNCGADMRKGADDE